MWVHRKLLPREEIARRPPRDPSDLCSKRTSLSSELGAFCGLQGPIGSERGFRGQETGIIVGKWFGTNEEHNMAPVNTNQRAPRLIVCRCWSDDGLSPLARANRPREGF